MPQMDELLLCVSGIQIYSRHVPDLINTLALKVPLSRNNTIIVKIFFWYFHKCTPLYNVPPMAFLIKSAYIKSYFPSGTFEYVLHWWKCYSNSGILGSD